jgi:hypothetical protein
MMRSLLWFALAFLALSPAWAGSGTANLSVNIQPVPVGGPVTLTQSIPAGSTGFTFGAGVGTNPIPSGSTVFGAINWETCFVGNTFCTNPGGLDHVTVGSQTAIILGTVEDPRCQSSSDCGAFDSGLGTGGFVTTLWWLPNVQGNPTSISYVASTNGQFYDGGSVASVFSGISSGATVDAAVGSGYSSSGAWNGDCCGNGYLQTVSNITPSQSGDFIYGVGVQYGSTPGVPGPGWNASNTTGTGFYGKADEWQVYNSTSPITAQFPASAGPVSWTATVAIKLQ